MTAEDATPDGGENVSEEQSGEPVQKPQTPKEARGRVPCRGALVRAEKRVSDTEMRVTGTSTPSENEPEVNLTIEAAGLSNSAVTLGLVPEEARELAAELRTQATHAEQWAAFERDREASNADV